MYIGSNSVQILPSLSPSPSLPLSLSLPPSLPLSLSPSLPLPLSSPSSSFHALAAEDPLRLTFPVREGMLLKPFQLEHGRTVSHKAFQLRESVHKMLLHRSVLHVYNHFLSYTFLLVNVKVRPHYNLDSIRIQSRSTKTRFNPHQSRPHYTTVCGLSARVLGTRTNSLQQRLPADLSQRERL